VLRFVVGLAVLALLVPVAASAYSWPIRPFYKQHGIRGYFNDPRLSGPETGFHFGVDISAQDHAPVYAIVGGRARVRGMSVSITPVRPGAPRLSYWHVMPVVASRQIVRRHQLIGHVAPDAGHVHLAEYKDGTYINPLRLGGLAPYIDDTVPQMPRLTFYSSDRTIPPETVSGTIDLTVDAFDPSPLPLPPEEWAQARLAPVYIRWRIVQGQNTIRQWETAVDFRTFLMPFSLFDFVYAPGTYQNRLYRPGRYEYYLAHDLDTRFLLNGSYVLQVDALDSQENVGQASFAFTVANPV
jgi:hypothetical protein